MLHQCSRCKRLAFKILPFTWAWKLTTGKYGTFFLSVLFHCKIYIEYKKKLLTKKKGKIFRIVFFLGLLILFSLWFNFLVQQILLTSLVVLINWIQLRIWQVTEVGHFGYWFIDLIDWLVLVMSPRLWVEIIILWLITVQLCTVGILEVFIDSLFSKAFSQNKIFWLFSEE